MNKKIILICITIIVFVIIITFIFLRPKTEPALNTLPATQQAHIVSETDPPQVVSTKPADLDGSLVSSSKTIEITFNRPLENVGEFKTRIEPEVNFKKTLSSDRKTGIITFEKPLELGKSYLLSIGADTKFDGVGNWGQTKEFRFRTTPYRGL
jgi:hypothetical protein